MKKVDVFRRVYRMDEMAEVEWSSVCSPVHAPGQRPPADDIGTTSSRQQDALRVEYLLSVVESHQWYRVKTPKAGLNADGVDVVEEETRYFQVLSTASDSLRPKLMPTIESNQDVVTRARLALNLQEASVKFGTESENGDVVVYSDTHAAWVSWKDLGPWDAVRSSLHRYCNAQGAAEHPSCVALTDVVPAVPQHPVTDFKCPTLYILTELYRRGWRPTLETVVHKKAIIDFMDGREAVRMKAYFIVLVELPRCIALTSSIPSDQPIAFYRLLLRGTKVEPGLGNPHYIAMFKDTERPMPIEAPIDEDPHLVLKVVTNASTLILETIDVRCVLRMSCVSLRAPSGPVPDLSYRQTFRFYLFGESSQ